MVGVSWLLLEFCLLSLVFVSTFDAQKLITFEELSSLQQVREVKWVLLRHLLPVNHANEALKDKPASSESATS